jgi:hypothetical protein
MVTMMKLVFFASVVTWAVGGIWIMTSGGTITFDMIHQRPVIVHHVAAVLSLALGAVLVVRWLWIKLYS